MANRFWVGGAGNWSSTTKWSTTSGGASGASVPTSVDDAIFDANSGGKFTATVDTAQSVNSITITPSAAVGVQQIALSARLTTGNLTTTGTAGNNRIWFRGNTYGIAQDFVVNGTVSISDCDFRDIYVIGTAAPISGTRIGDLRGIRGITADAPKTVYWNRVAGGNWSTDSWATSSGGATSIDNFPLAQDTAVIENTGLNTSATVIMDNAVPYTGGIDMSTRTNAMTLATNTLYTIYGNWTNGSGTAFSGAGLGQTFSGRNTQTITSAGKSFNGALIFDSYGGAVELADALNMGFNTLTVTNGTFDTKNYNVTAGSFSSSNSNVRTINLGSSTVTTSGVIFGTATNLTFNAGTSLINIDNNTVSLGGGNVAFYDVAFTGVSAATKSINGDCSFRNLTLPAPSSAGLMLVTTSGNLTITGTLTCAGATAVRRIFLRSDTLGTTRTLTVNSLSATNCDFRDITIAGTAAGSSPTRAGDCGGNTGITFPAAKTVYWNLAGTNSWTATAWAPSSGGTPDINQFPLAQDTAVINDAGAVTRINNSDVNVGAVDFSGRTTAVTFGLDVTSNFYGSFTLSSAVTLSGGSGQFFAGRGTMTITSAGKSFLGSITVECATGTVQLADGFTSFSLILNNGTFDAVTYNVTLTNNFSAASAVAPVALKMGSGTWTLSGTGTVWTINSTPTFYKGTANIVLSDTSATARTFAGGSLSYNKLTIGGATGTSTTTITGNNQFTELASTKTVAHTIALGTTTQTFGAWTVTGTAGNVVTVTGTAALTIAGAAVSGLDYLALGTTTVSATSPGEFYAGVNSTATSAAAPLYLTAKPADSTRYWVGGTGNWSDTARWSTSSGGGSGASVPRSHDDVVFDALSNATAYTATVNAVTGGIRTKALTVAGPLVGNLTLAGSTAIDGIHGNVTLPATGLTRTYTGAITLSGSSTGRTFTSNGVALASFLTVNGVNCEWTLGSALDIGSSTFILTNGTFALSTYSFTLGGATSNNANSRTFNLGSSTVTFSGNVSFGTTETNAANLTITAGTSQLNFSAADANLAGNNKTFYNVSYTSTARSTSIIGGANTFNNLTIAGRTSAGIGTLSISGNQTINGTLTLSAGTNATMRTFVQSDTIGTTRTLTCAAFSGTDADFRDITIAGAAAPVSGTRLGDCKGNSGITFDVAKTVYWRSGTTASWGSSVWSATSGGTADLANFPLPQDTVVFPSSPTPYPTSGNTATINAAYNIGTIDMSARTSNTMTLATSTNTPTIYGNWINGTGTTLTGTGTMTFGGRGSQTITSAGKTFTQGFTINTPGGSVAFQDAFTVNVTSTFTHTAGTLDGNGYNVTLSNSSNAFSTAGTATRTLAIGSGTWTFAGTGGTAFNASTSTNLTVTGTGTISLTSASAKTFNGGGASFSGITLNQGGAGTLTISGNNTFANISNTYKATGATTIAMGTTTQTVGSFTASGEAGRVLTVQGTSASSPATLILTGGTVTTPDYLTITGVRAYNLVDTWYAGANSTNNGSLGWYFEAGGGGPITAFIIESATAADEQSPISTLNITVSEMANAADAQNAGLLYLGTLSESATAADVAEAIRAYLAEISESTTATDLISASLNLAAAISELTTAADSAAVTSRVTSPTIEEAAQMADTLAGGLLFLSDISEATTAQEIAASILIFNRAISEATTAAEVSVAIAVFQAAVPEQVSGADVANTLITAGAAINEALTALDSAVGPKTSSSTISEEATTSESLANVYTANPTILELAQGADEAQVVASTFGAASAETASPLDTPQGANTGSSSLSESASVSDSGAAAFIAPTAVSESAQTAESVSSRAVFLGPIVEAASSADSTSVAPSTFSAIALAAAEAFGDSNPAGSIYNAILPVETARATDSLIGAYLWNPIDDNQTPNWQNVNNTQSVTWTPVNDNQTPGWTPTIP